MSDTYATDKPMSDAERVYNVEHVTGTAQQADDDPVRRSRRFSRHQRVTITQAILLFVFTLVLCQLWLFTATLNAYLGGDERVVWPGAIASLACLGLNIGLLRHLYYLEQPAPSAETKGPP